MPAYRNRKCWRRDRQITLRPCDSRCAWARGHPWLADGLLAAALLVVTAPQLAAGQASAAARGAFTVLAVLLAATLVPRRRYPVAAFTVAAVIGAAQILLGVQNGSAPPVFPLQPTNADLAILVLLYTLAAYRPRPVSIAGLVVCLTGSALAIARWSPAHGAHPTGALFGAAAGLSERDAQARIATAAERARELQERRARAVDESAARLRRIERDLHDGAQVRLAALAMTLGEIKENLEQSAADDRTHDLVGAAYQNAKDTLAELRDLARGEAIAYFCTAELLANVTKHSGASRVTIGVSEPASGLTLTVTDDGDGDARLVPGGGLSGLLERVQTVDGLLEIDSPPGGPTVITIELPRHA